MSVIGRKLRLMYADIIAEGVPERFAEILRRLVEPSNEGSKNDPAYHLTMTKGEPMMLVPPQKRRLSAEQRRALAMLADAEQNRRRRSDHVGEWTPDQDVAREARSALRAVRVHSLTGGLAPGAGLRWAETTNLGRASIPGRSR